ncbi:MAG TPA: hypothetical protein VF008_01365 [Niastella sp.]
MGKVVFENETTSFLRIAWPQPVLNDLIAYYFEVDATGSPEPVRITGLPSVNTLIAIDLNKEQDIRLMGHLTHCVTGSYAPGAKAFYAKLKPGVFTALFPFTAQHIQDDQVETHQLFRGLSTGQFSALPSFRQRIDLFESYLLQHFYPFKIGYRQQHIQVFMQLFSNAQYCKPERINTLCNNHNITYASLRRYFLEQVGVSPKYCQKVIRFKAALQAYRTFGYNFHYPDFGYSDFSHFCKDARSLTGKAPLEL